jgi:acyl-CoA thioesterase-1
MIARLKERGIDVILAGMLAPPNMGDDYAAGSIRSIRNSPKNRVPLYEFFLDGAVTDSDLMLADGMHPNARGVDRMVEGSCR